MESVVSLWVCSLPSLVWSGPTDDAAEATDESIGLGGLEIKCSGRLATIDGDRLPEADSDRVGPLRDLGVRHAKRRFLACLRQNRCLCLCARFEPAVVRVAGSLRHGTGLFDCLASGGLASAQPVA